MKVSFQGGSCGRRHTNCKMWPLRMRASPYSQGTVRPQAVSSQAVVLVVSPVQGASGPNPETHGMNEVVGGFPKGKQA